MRAKLTWLTLAFFGLVIACAPLAVTPDTSGEEMAAGPDVEEGTTAEPSHEHGSNGEHAPPHLPEVRPRVDEILPPTPSVYESVPAESLTTWVAKVNDDPICPRLFERCLSRNRFFAYQYFKDKYGARGGRDFWTTSYDGEVPNEWLKQRTVKECVRIKIELGLAQENVVIADSSYAAFLQALEKENQSRREYLAAGLPIYGPQQYKEDEFFLYVMNNMRITLQKRLWHNRLHASEETLREYYESIKGKHYDRGNRVKVWGIAIHYGQREGYPDALTRDEAKVKIEEAKERLEKGERFEGLASEYNENGSLNEEVFDFENRSADKTHRYMRRLEAMKLAEGETSGIFEDMSAFFIVKCIEREDLGYRPFEEVRHNVRSHYTGEKYAELIDDLVRNAKVEINESVYDEIAVR
jgi:hypothetical protein